MISVTICIHDCNNMFSVMICLLRASVVYFMVMVLLHSPGRCLGFLGSTIASSGRNSAENSSTGSNSAMSWLKNIAGEHAAHMHDGWHLPTSDQSRASHSGGQLWLLQGSVREGRREEHAESSRTFSSVAEILLLHNTSRVRRPPLQLRLHSDHSPVHQLEARLTFISFF